MNPPKIYCDIIKIVRAYNIYKENSNLLPEENSNKKKLNRFIVLARKDLEGWIIKYYLDIREQSVCIPHDPMAPRVNAEIAKVVNEKIVVLDKHFETYGVCLTKFQKIENFISENPTLVTELEEIGKDISKAKENIRQAKMAIGKATKTHNEYLHSLKKDPARSAVCSTPECLNKRCKRCKNGCHATMCTNCIEYVKHDCDTTEMDERQTAMLTATKINEDIMRENTDIVTGCETQRTLLLDSVEGHHYDESMKKNAENEMKIAKNNLRIQFCEFAESKLVARAIELCGEADTRLTE